MNAEIVESCTHCGLPVSAGWFVDKAETPTAATEQTGNRAEPVFCCFGCRFASAVALENNAEGAAQWTLTRLGLAIFFSMTVMVFTLAMWTQDVYSDASLDSERGLVLFELFRHLCLLFAAPVVLLLGVPLFQNGFEDLRERRITTDLLIVVGVASAFGYSVVSVWLGWEHVYFEVACMVLTAVTLGRWLEATGKQRASDSLRRLEQLLPTTARRVGLATTVDDDSRSANTSVDEVVPLDELAVGDLVRVLAGERFPVDGVIRQGSAAIDQQLITGESEPALKQVGDEVFSGALNIDGDLVVRVAAPAAEGALKRIIDSVRHAALAKGRVQQLADRIAAWFVPAVAAIAVATLATHWWLSGLEAGLMAFLAVLLIACPCALGIATPMAVYAALGRAARQGVLFRNGDAIEQFAAARSFCFDKTGTLTTGLPEVERFLPADNIADETVLQTANALASRSTHALSQAISEYSQNAVRADEADVEMSVTTLAGRGVTGELANQSERWHLGSERLMRDLGIALPPELERAIAAAKTAGKSVVCVAAGENVIGLFVLNERIRDHAEQTVRELLADDIKVSLLTGDHETDAVGQAKSWGMSVYTELLPDEKLAYIAEQQAADGPVVMVGDGINDAPALAQADTGIAMECGADVSRDAADICLLGGDLSKIGWAFAFAKQANKTIRQNLVWAFAYNGVGILLAAAGLLNPIWAAVLMVGSSLFVVSNSLRLAGGDDDQAAAPAFDEKTEANHNPAPSDATVSTPYLQEGV